MNANEQANIQLNPYENLMYNAINNPFLINSLTNSILLNMNNKGIFKLPNQLSKSGPYESNSTNLVSKDRIKQKRTEIESDSDLEMMDDEETKNLKNIK